MNQIERFAEELGNFIRSEAFYGEDAGEGQMVVDFRVLENRIDRMVAEQQQCPECDDIWVNIDQVKSVLVRYGGLRADAMMELHKLPSINKGTKPDEVDVVLLELENIFSEISYDHNDLATRFSDKIADIRTRRKAGE
jgi:hypothetical protein